MNLSLILFRLVAIALLASSALAESTIAYTYHIGKTSKAWTWGLLMTPFHTDLGTLKSVTYSTSSIGSGLVTMKRPNGSLVLYSRTGYASLVSRSRADLVLFTAKRPFCLDITSSSGAAVTVTVKYTY